MKEEQFENGYCKQDKKVNGNPFDVPVGKVQEAKGIKEDKREKSVVKMAENRDCESGRVCFGAAVGLGWRSSSCAVEKVWLKGPMF